VSIFFWPILVKNYWLLFVFVITVIYIYILIKIVCDFVTVIPMMLIIKQTTFMELHMLYNYFALSVYFSFSSLDHVALLCNNGNIYRVAQ